MKFMISSLLIIKEGVRTYMNIKKAFVSGAIAVSILASAVPVFAVPSAPNYNENMQNCFGQDRAAYIHANEPGAMGAAASERKGDNASINHDYHEACQQV